MCIPKVTQQFFFRFGRQQRSEFENADSIWYRSSMERIKYYEFLSFSDMKSNRFNRIRSYASSSTHKEYKTYTAL